MAMPTPSKRGHRCQSSGFDTSPPTFTWSSHVTALVWSGLGQSSPQRHQGFRRRNLLKLNAFLHYHNLSSRPFIHEICFCKRKFRQSFGGMVPWIYLPALVDTQLHFSVSRPWAYSSENSSIGLVHAPCHQEITPNACLQFTFCKFLTGFGLR